MITKQTIIDTFNESTLRKSFLRLPNGEEIVTNILKGKGFGTILEIGTFRGVGAAFMSQFCDKMITMDLDSRGKKHKKFCHYVWDTLEIDNIKLICIKDNAEKQEILKNLHFDFAFIDGAHDRTIKQDFEWTKKCGNVLFHDYADSGTIQKNYVYDFINTLPSNELTINDVFALWEK